MTRPLRACACRFLPWARRAWLWRVRVVAWLAAAGTLLGGARAAGEPLFAELGCVQCHEGLPGRSRIREQAPALDDAGLRYRTAYLLEYLLRPQRVRRQIGAARMPDYHLAEPEALALALFLETQRRAPVLPAPLAWPDALRPVLETPPAPVAAAEFDEEMRSGLICFTCHAWQGKGGAVAPDLAEVGAQLQPGWMATYLVAPDLFGVPPTVMPAQFYQVSADRARFVPLRPAPGRSIATLVGHLASVGAPRAALLETAFNRVRTLYPRVTAAQGEQLFRALSCAACHRHETIAPPKPSAPSLAAEGWRARRDWLESFLAHPTALRPAGVAPGDGQRMPDFRLTPAEAGALAAALAAQRASPVGGTPAPADPGATNRWAPLSAFAAAKTRRLLEEKWSCLGCHRLDGRGGRVGPALDDVGSRRSPDYIAAIVADPARVAPHAIMPKVPLSAAARDALTRFLVQQKGTKAAVPDYLPPLETNLPLSVPSAPATHGAAGPRWSARDAFLRHCAPCHGPEGRGDGFNARFLGPVRPTALADREILRARPDDTLFDGIHAGGAILNRSHWMPPWGETLSATEIRALVGHLRELCGCEGPDWSRDGERPGPARPAAAPQP